MSYGDTRPPLILIPVGYTIEQVIYMGYDMLMKPIASYLKDTVDSLMKYCVYTQLISAYIVSIRNDVVVMGIEIGCC